MRKAAVFDLDRTLIRGASGPVVSEALRSVGVLPDRSIPGEGILFKVFDLVGETRPSMMMTRQLARAAKGWDIAAVAEAGHLVARPLEEAVQPFARAAIEEHRDAGDVLIMATTTPRPLVEPLAELLGFDAVVATTYGVDHGTYDGTIDGEFVWGKGKLRAVRAWTEQNNVDLANGSAYSDSWYDSPLLRAVAHPVAVNPDPRLLMAAMVRRWPVVWFDVPPGIPKLGGLIEPQQVAMAFARGELFPYVRFDIEGLHHVPAEGPAIIAGNHRSYFDPLAVGFALAKVGRPVRFLGKKEVFDAPIVGDVAKAMGGIRVDRGTGSDEPLEQAAKALQAGELVAVMPQGTIPRGRAFFDPELKGRWGTAKLAAMGDAVVIPMGLWGTEKIWPRSARLPNLTNVLDPPTVRIRVGPPLHLPADPDTATAELMAAIVALLPPEAREFHEPSPEELALTLPSGYKGDLDQEIERRPGTD